MDEYDYKDLFFRLLKSLNGDEHRGDVADTQIYYYSLIGIEADQCSQCYGIYPLEDLAKDDEGNSHEICKWCWEDLEEEERENW